ncbi:proline racemase family protein [Enterococcus faecalis]|uniref:proline racemase family protein n=1 Tax=Enterococcus faecalis TaxID=1351 RepID=UPI000AA628A7|nr:proline racemase family protein [Enterococcus faecalis]
MAVMYAKGELKLNEPFRHQGLLGVVYKGELIEETTIGDYKAIVPTITSCSWIYGFNNLVLDPTDPFTEGFTIGDIWA